MSPFSGGVVGIILFIVILSLSASIGPFVIAAFFAPIKALSDLSDADDQKKDDLPNPKRQNEANAN